MTATDSASRPYTLDVSGTEQIPFARLVRVEARKMFDTKAGFWLLLITALLLVAAAAITLLVVLTNDFDLTAGVLVQIMIVPLSLLLWSQRTGLVTFTHEPRRIRVAAAKLATVVLLVIATFAVAIALGALCNVLYGALSGNTPVWDLEAGLFFWTVVNQLLYFLMAFGFGVALHGLRSDLRHSQLGSRRGPLGGPRLCADPARVLGRRRPRCRREGLRAGGRHHVRLGGVAAGPGRLADAQSGDQVAHEGRAVRAAVISTTATHPADAPAHRSGRHLGSARTGSQTSYSSSYR